MPKFKVTHNVKPKRTEQANLQTLQQLNNWIDKVFNIQIAQIQYQKPRIKAILFLYQDQTTFIKYVKEGAQLKFIGALRKEKTEEQLKKQKIQMEKIYKMKQQIMLNPHQIIVKRLKKQGITQRGIQYFDYDIQERKMKDLGIQYALCPLHLLKRVPEFVKYCNNYEVMQQNPDGLIFQEFKDVFKQLDKGKHKNKQQNDSVISQPNILQKKLDEYQTEENAKQEDDGVACPLQWISGWITYCSTSPDDIQYPYPTYDLDNFLNMTFGTIKKAHDVQQERKQELSNSQTDIASKLFGIQVSSKRTNLTQWFQDDPLYNKQVDKIVTKYFLESDLSKLECTTLLSGIKQRFKQKILWQNFLNFDFQYSQKIHSIQSLSKYLFIHANRFGYMPAKQECQKVELSQDKKSYHRVRYNRIIDLYSLLNSSLQQNLYGGRHERQQMFDPYDMDERFPEFKKTIKCMEQLSDNQVRHMFFDHILHINNVYHQYNFQKLKGAKPTGQYRLIGLILHKGDYYHGQCKEHKYEGNQDCRGHFMTMVYDRGTRWLKFHKAQVEVITIQEATDQKYWGVQGQWTPVLFMYTQIKMKCIPVEISRKVQTKKAQKKTTKQQIQRMRRQQKQQK